MPASNLLRASAALMFVLLAGGAQDAYADGPGADAIEEFRGGGDDRPAIDNRFFLKRNRFEITPSFGYVPNNPFAKRFVGGLFLAFHFSERWAAEGLIAYSPDLEEDDLKGLTGALVTIAHTGPGGADFQQPLDKIQLWAVFGGRWSPLYGKLNLIGETVLNFDLYFSAGLGVVSKIDYFAKFDSSRPNNTILEPSGNKVKLAPSLGVGTNFFLNQTLALKLDGRFSFYLDDEPQYSEDQEIERQQLYNNFTISGGLGFYFPRMKPRLYDF